MITIIYYNHHQSLHKPVEAASVVILSGLDLTSYSGYITVTHGDRSQGQGGDGRGQEEKGRGQEKQGHGQGDMRRSLEEKEHGQDTQGRGLGEIRRGLEEKGRGQEPESPGHVGKGSHLFFWFFPAANVSDFTSTVISITGNLVEFTNLNRGKQLVIYTP